MRKANGKETTATEKPVHAIPTQQVQSRRMFALADNGVGNINAVEAGLDACWGDNCEFVENPEKQIRNGLSIIARRVALENARTRHFQTMGPQGTRQKRNGFFLSEGSA